MQFMTTKIIIAFALISSFSCKSGDNSEHHYVTKDLNSSTTVMIQEEIDTIINISNVELSGVETKDYMNGNSIPEKKVKKQRIDKPLLENNLDPRVDDMTNLGNLDTVEDSVKSISKERPVIYNKPVKSKIKVKGTGSPTHRLWNDLLSIYVSKNGSVNYTEMLSKAYILDAYLDELKVLSPKDSWSEYEKKAYWINVYNAFTVKLILDNYPIKSITELHEGRPWDIKWINIGNEKYSLNNIENDIIRPQFNDPRIHFAINCAAKSCPPLANRAYTVNNVESLLDSNTRSFVNNKRYNSLSNRNIKVSKIFDWYKEDFDNIAIFISSYASSTVYPTARVEFKKYDWSLNGN